jgi:hypothetical protein
LLPTVGNITTKPRNRNYKMIGTAALDKICLWTPLFNWDPYEGLWERPALRVKGEAMGYPQYQQPKGAKDYALDIKNHHEEWKLYVRYNPSKVDPAEVQKRIKQDTGVIFDYEKSNITRCDIQRTGHALYPVIAFHSVMEASAGRKPRRSTYQDTITLGTLIRQLQMYDKGKEQKTDMVNYLRLEARLLKSEACQMAGIITVQDLLEWDPAELYRNEVARMLPNLNNLNNEDYNQVATLHENYAHLINEVGNEGLLRTIFIKEGIAKYSSEALFAWIDSLDTTRVKKSKLRRQLKDLFAKYPIPKQADIIAELLRFVA